MTDAGADKDEALPDHTKSLLNILIKHDLSAAVKRNINFYELGAAYKLNNAAAKGDIIVESMKSITVRSTDKGDWRAGKKI